VMYVWLDALTNYITGLGYPNGGAEWDNYWPADMHLIGKDVVRFHAVYWPAFLMSAGIELPRMVYGHGHVLLRGEKMSKSAGNVVDPMDMAERFGVDAVRYFLMREISFGQDGSYSDEAIVTRANAELANSFGNLAQRTFSMIFKNLDGVVPPVGEAAEDVDLLTLVHHAIDGLTAEFRILNFSSGLQEWMTAVFACNAYVDATAPWALRKSDPHRMAEVLGTLAAAVKLLTKAVEPIVPASAQKLLAYIEAGEREGRIAPPQPIFPRLELEAATSTSAGRAA
jgi:methionyl-tRNA synthetase